jgi:hypothetical protein
MAQQIVEAASAPDPSTLQPLHADALLREHDDLRALRRRLETATEALIRVGDQLKARASWCPDCDHNRRYSGSQDGGPDPHGGRP